ncbi:hypothetical protein [Poseidonocella sp. HB161398]|uniref:hypothetical protein n=1 Tax=Poseidonocella sp. HB161398 TaxID=2320855 RepID=UPI001107CA30|nr:hypothetical protein [Poseidonocella sp. HB161398]
MNDIRIPQTLVLPPDTAFAAIARTLEELGFTQAETGTVTAPIVAGEPEIANWTWYGTLPVIQYSFNPVVRLRLLEVATVPPELRGRIARALQALSPADVSAALRESDDRRCLFGVWAAVETERIDLIRDVERVRDGASGLLREEVDLALLRLGDLATARYEMLATGRALSEAVLELVNAMADPALRARLAPTEEDCAAAFHASIVPELWEAVRQGGLPGRYPRLEPVAADALIAAPAGAFRWSNELSDGFPGGYRKIAGWMDPGRIWLAWRGTEPDGGTRLMDGLVFLGERWVWMPKVFRLVEPLILRLPLSEGQVRH